MTWKNSDDNPKDPWSGRDRETPPDLEEIFRDVRSKANSWLGRENSRHNASSPHKEQGNVNGLWFFIFIGVGLWMMTGIYIVNPPERGVVLQFGQFQETSMPGLHWRWPIPIESVELVDVDQVRSLQHKALMLTKDENLVELELAVQYRVKNAENYLFKVRDPDATLKDAIESAVREIVGRSEMDFVLTQGRSEVVIQGKALIQDLLDRYESGIELTSVNLQDAQPPEEVQGAFADAIKAREDEQRLKNEAEAYANEVIPKARGAAARQLAEANAYNASVIANSQGEAERFLKILEEYKKAPGVTRQRMYLETMEEILSKTNKIILDTKSTTPLLYLPLNQSSVPSLRSMTAMGGSLTPSEADINSNLATVPPVPVSSAVIQENMQRSRDRLRERDSREETSKP